MSTSIVVGLGLIALGVGGRHLMRKMPQLAQQTEQALKQGTFAMNANSKYYKGGFDAKMTKREAGLILGVSPSASVKRVKDAHKRIMLLNHPDRGGSPYLAAKINEAKDYIDKHKHE